MKIDLITAILTAVAAVCFLVCFVAYVISGHWLLAALYMTVAGIDGASAFLSFHRWLIMRQLMREIDSEDEDDE